MENKEKSSKKKTKLILIIIGSLLILIGLFLFWFFNRKFDVTFKVNDSDKYAIKVKYNHKINEEDIKTKEELGENFIAWYEVISTENDKDVLAKDSFDFSTKIKKNIILKATYKAEEETITITFDTKGGSKIDSITIKKGEELTLPNNPTKNDYTFITWELSDGTSINNETKFDEDTTLYANWKKIIEKVTISFDTNGGNKINNITTNKGSTISFPTNPIKDGYTFKGWTLKNGSSVNSNTKFNENTTLYASWTKKEEKISLSLSRSAIHRDGYNTSKAIAKVENASGDVTYSTNNATCITIDKKTGEIKADAVPTSGAKAKYWLERCANKSSSITITATLPSGKSASATLNLEADLTISPSNSSLQNYETLYITDTKKLYPADSNKRFTINANQVVTWTTSVSNTYKDCTPVAVTSTSKSFTSTLNASCADGNARNTYVTATTPANQSITVQYYQNLN